MCSLWFRVSMKSAVVVITVLTFLSGRYAELGVSQFIGGSLC